MGCHIELRTGAILVCVFGIIVLLGSSQLDVGRSVGRFTSGFGSVRCTGYGLQSTVLHGPVFMAVVRLIAVAALVPGFHRHLHAHTQQGHLFSFRTIG